MINFWKKLPEPFLVLAPMEDVTDFVFREIMMTLPKPDVLFTEFVSIDGLNSKGRESTIRKLRFSSNQRPVVAQIWGIDPDLVYKSAKLVSKLGFDGIDINMGCPDRAVMKKGAGAALCLNESLAKDIIGAARKGAKDIPLSVKTRLGVSEVLTTQWIPFLLSQKLDALTIHGRTANQMSTGLASWEEIGKAVKLKEMLSPDTVIIGNGDIKSFAQAKDMSQKYGVSGVMIGRGVFSNPWVFKKDLNPIEHSKEDYLKLLIEHVNLYEKTWGNTKNFAVMKKFFKMYVNNFPLASVLRQQLMECKDASEVVKVIQDDSLKYL